MSRNGELRHRSNENAGELPDLRRYSTQELNDFIDSFDTILSDCDGVLWRSHDPIEGALEVLLKFQNMGKKVFFVTNNSTLPMEVTLKKFHTLGFPVKREQIIMPSLVVAWYLKSIEFEGEVYVAGTAAFKNVLRENGIKVARSDPDCVDEDIAAIVEALEDVPNIKAIVHDFDPNMNWMKIMRSIISLRRDDCLYIAAASDTKVPVGDKPPFLGVKIFTDLVSEMSGREPVLTGKPSQLLKEYVFKKCPITNPERCLFIGDSLLQDIGFAGLCGFQKLFVSSGITSHNDALIEKETPPDFYIPSLGAFLPIFEKLNAHHPDYNFGR